MTFFDARPILTHTAVLTMLAAAIKEAEKIDVPQCIVIVDASGELLGEIRMTGAKFLSRKSALAKALTAASTGGPSAAIPETVRPAIGAATGGLITGLPGGLPVKKDGSTCGRNRNRFWNRRARYHRCGSSAKGYRSGHRWMNFKRTDRPYRYLPVPQWIFPARSRTVWP